MGRVKFGNTCESPYWLNSGQSLSMSCYSLSFFFFEVYLIYEVVLVSGAQQSDSVTHIYVFFLDSFPL